MSVCSIVVCNTSARMEFKETRKKRLSILKTPKPQNEQENGKAQSPSTKTIGNRVSFSSNYIKHFTTDEEKNTIWDSTIEESINNTESTNSAQSAHSINYQNLDMSMTMNNFCHESSMELTDCVFESENKLIGEKENIFIFEQGAHKSELSLIEGSIANRPAIAEKENIPPLSLQTFHKKTEIEKIKILSIHHLTGSREVPSPQENQRNNESNIVEDMEISYASLSEKTSASMEFTCRNPILASSPSDDMEFTCKNRFLILGPPGNTESTFGNPIPPSEEDMQFTCRNPILVSGPSGNEAGPQQDLTLNAEEDMQFTCRNPILVSGPSGNEAGPQQDLTLNAEEDMQFTCKIPILVSGPSGNEAGPQQDLTLNAEEDMQFTCRNPILVSGSSGNEAGLRQDLTLNAEEDMQFTCKIPVLVSGPPENETGPRQDLTLNVEEDMQFTCKYPILVSGPSENEACPQQDPTLNSPIAMEFTCRNPLPSNASVDMDFTCRDPTPPSNLRPEMNFTCKNRTLAPVTDPEVDSIKDIPSTSIAPIMIHDSVKDAETTNNEFTLKCNATEIIERIYDEQNLTATAQARGCKSILEDSNATAVLLRGATFDKTYEVTNTTRSLLREVSLIQYELPKLVIDSFSDEPEVELPLYTSDRSGDEVISDQVSTSDLVNENCVYSTEKLTDTMIDDEISPDLVNSSNDVSGDNLKANNEKEVKVNISMRSSRNKTFQSDDSWNLTKYLTEKRERDRKFNEKIRAIKIEISEEAEANKKELQAMFQKVQGTLSKTRNLEKKFAEKYAKFSEYRSRILQEVIDDRNAKSLESTQSTNRDSSGNFEDIEGIIPSLAKRIAEKAEMSGCKWGIIKIEENVAYFSALLGKLEVCLEYNSFEIVTKLDTKSLLTSTSRPITFLLEKEFLRSLTVDKVNNSIGHRYTVITFLDYLQLVMQNIIEYYLDLKDIEKKYQLELTYDYRASFIILDADLIIKWIFKIDLSNLDDITDDCVTIENRIGRIDKKKVMSFVPECTKGVQFIRSFLTKITEYIELLRKRQRLVSSREGAIN